MDNHFYVTVFIGNLSRISRKRLKRVFATRVPSQEDDTIVPDLFCEMLPTLNIIITEIGVVTLAVELMK